MQAREGDSTKRPGAVTSRRANQSERVALAFVLTLAALLRLWHLSQNGFGNTYYAAAVRSISLNGHNALFGAYDPAGFLSVDKPPLILWIQALAVKALGYSPVALHLPQALAGVASVAVLWRLVRGAFGPAAGLVAALALALTPISVAVDRSNILDSWLVLFLLLAAGAFLTATRTGRLNPLLAGALLLGLGFNVKMLAAFVLVPSLYAVYLLGVAIPWRRRLLHLTAATGLMLAVSLSWVLLMDATLPERRPYVGGSQSNRALELAFGYNGTARIVGGQGQIQGTDPIAADAATVSATPMFGGAPGPRRLLEPGLAGQALWLLPLALAGLIGGALTRTWRLPLAPKAQQTVLWSGWLLSCGIVFSLAHGTFHPYYLALLAPPLAALTGISVTVAAEGVAMEGRRGALLTGLALAALVLTALWQAALGRAWPPLSVVLTLAPLCGTLAASGALLIAHLLRPAGRAWQAVAGGGLIALLVGPALWCAVTIQIPESFAMPLAGPPNQYRMERTQETQDLYRRADPRLIAFLHSHRHGERFLLAVPTAYTASPIIVRTGEPVIAIGGFLGIDPAVSLDSFRQMIQARQLRYVLLVPGEAWEGGGPNAALFDWVQENGKPVDSTLWQSPENASRFYGVLYDCMPDAPP